MVKLRLAEWPLSLVALILTPPLFVLTLVTQWLTRKRNVRIALSVSDSHSPILVFSKLACSLALARCGAEITIVSPDAAPFGNTLDAIDGVLLSGGEDIWREDAPDDGTFNSLRDQKESVLLAKALECGLPVLGICRGMQLLALHCGGALASHKDDPAKRQRHLPRVFGPLLHEVEVLEGTILRKALGGPRLKILSIHGDHVASPGRAVVSAKDLEDGMIEAIELQEADFAIGVQWHPEIRSILNLSGAKLVEVLVERAADKRKIADNRLNRQNRT